MEMLMILLLMPLAIPVIAKSVFSHKITFTEMFIQMAAVCVPITLLVIIGYVGQTMDVEVWNGKITDKSRDHGHYERAYDCYCYRDKDGFEHCQTCYEDRYTVTWGASTTVGNFTFKHLDSGSRGVYDTPDPIEYVNCRVGEPASIEHTFQNLVKAVPESLFNKSMNQEEFAIPSYPRVYNFYKINRVINVGSKIPKKELDDLNKGLNEALIHLGKTKQVNVIVIVTENDDPMYRHAVENKWLGGKKNDVVIFLGTDDKEYTWVDVMTFGMNIGNETFVVQLRDAILSQKTFNATEIVVDVTKNVLQYFKRPEMKRFDYLRDAIELPSWVIITSVIITILGSIILTFYFYTHDIHSGRSHIHFRRRRL